MIILRGGYRPFRRRRLPSGWATRMSTRNWGIQALVAAEWQMENETDRLAKRWPALLHAVEGRLQDFPVLLALGLAFAASTPASRAFLVGRCT